MMLVLKSNDLECIHAVTTYIALTSNYLSYKGKDFFHVQSETSISSGYILVIF